MWGRAPHETRLKATGTQRWLVLADPATAALVACLVVYLYAIWRSFAGDRRFALYGPAVLVRCSRCAEAIKRLAAFSRLRAAWLGVAAWLAGMVMGMAMLVESAANSFTLPPEQAPSPTLLIGLPGINPLIPLWYGLLGLAIAIAVHELAHGITLAANRLPAKSAGLVLLGVPLGAFVEPPEEFQNAKPSVKVKVFSAGPFANFATTLLTILLLSQLMAGVKPVALGVGVVGVLQGSPAELANIKPGSIIVAVNESKVVDLESFLAAMSKARAGSTATITLNDGRVVKLTLADKYDFTKNLEDKGQGFMGVSVVDLKELLNEMSFTPIASGGVLGMLRKLLLIPFSMNPSALPYLQSFYTAPSGGWEAVYATAWIAWINLAAGLTNALPIVPFDGGSALKVALEATLKGLPEVKKKRIVDALSISLSLLTLALILAPVVVPRLRALLWGSL